jgi:hypothetical protein
MGKLEQRICANCKHWLKRNDDSPTGLCEELSKRSPSEVKTEESFSCSLFKSKNETK